MLPSFKPKSPQNDIMPSLSHLYNLTDRVRTLLVKYSHFPISLEYVIGFATGCRKRIRLVLGSRPRELRFPERLVGIIQPFDPQDMVLS
jgi:hypothetical protein